MVCRCRAACYPAIKAVEEGRTRFVPERWSKTYFEWMRNIQPWCVSRQLWWGHRIPAWYGPDGTPFIELDEAARKKQQTHIMARLSALSKMKMYLIPGSQAPYGHFQRLAGQKIPLSSNAIILVMCLSQALILSFSGLPV